MNLTRIAPTPSGFLHIGNLINFKVVDLLAGVLPAKIALRIDDVDAARVRPEYVEDIFEKLEYLSIRPDIGPKSESELSDFSQSGRLDDYRALLAKLRLTTDLVFVCDCSRTQRVAGRCVSNCSTAKKSYEPNRNAIRMRFADADEVLWRRDDLPAYHLTDIYDDLELGVTHVVRGSDLFAATEKQSEIRRLLKLPKPTYLFHPLISSGGEKISKSTGTNHLQLDASSLRQIEETAKGFLDIVQNQLTNPIESVADLPDLDIHSL